MSVAPLLGRATMERIANVIIGGGISGLTSAFYLLKSGVSAKNIVLLEGSSRFGSWIRSDKRSDGTVCEYGPKSLRIDEVALKLVDDLGLSSEVLFVSRDHDGAKNRFIVINNNLVKLPSRLSSLMKPVPELGRFLVGAIMRDTFTSKKLKLPDESVFNFANRRFGSKVASYIVDPMCRGIFAGNAKEISIRSVFEPIFAAEQEHGRAIIGYLRNSLSARKTQSLDSNSLFQRAKDERWAIWSFKDGVETLIKTLEQRLKGAGVSIRHSSSVDCLKFSDGCAEVKFGASSVLAQHVYSACPAKGLSKIIGNDDHSALTGMLNEITYVTVAVMTVEYEGDLIPVKGFGCLVPSNQPNSILGITFDSCFFQGNTQNTEDKTRLTVMLGGRWFHELFSDYKGTQLQNSIMKAAFEDIASILGITKDPINCILNISENCIPQHTVGHIERIRKIREYIKNHKLPLSLLGSSYDNVGVSGCISHTKNIVTLNSTRFGF